MSRTMVKMDISMGLICQRPYQVVLVGVVIACS